jgi:hypothetical protein
MVRVQETSAGTALYKLVGFVHDSLLGSIDNGLPPGTEYRYSKVYLYSSRFAASAMVRSGKPAFLCNIITGIVNIS